LNGPRTNEGGQSGAHRRCDQPEVYKEHGAIQYFATHSTFLHSHATHDRDLYNVDGSGNFDYTERIDLLQGQAGSMVKEEIDINKIEWAAH
jgi:hypothetical protein